MKKALLKSNVPYAMDLEDQVLSRKEIRDVISYLNDCQPADNIGFERVVNEPKRRLELGH